MTAPSNRDGAFEEIWNQMPDSANENSMLKPYAKRWFNKGGAYERQRLLGLLNENDSKIQCGKYIKEYDWSADGVHGWGKCIDWLRERLGGENK